MNIYEEINHIASQHRVFGAQYAVLLTEEQMEGLDEVAPKHADLASMPVDSQAAQFGAYREFLGLSSKDYLTPIEIDRPDGSDIVSEVEAAAESMACDHVSPIVQGDNFIMVAPAVIELYRLHAKLAEDVSLTNAFGQDVSYIADDMVGKIMDHDNGKGGGYGRKDMLRMDWPAVAYLDGLTRAAASVKRMEDAAAKYPASKKALEQAKQQLQRMRLNKPTCEYGAGYENEETAEELRVCRKYTQASFGHSQESAMAKATQAWVDGMHRDYVKAFVAKAVPYQAPVYDNFKQALAAVKAVVPHAQHADFLAVSLAADIFQGRRERATVKLSSFMTRFKAAPTQPALNASIDEWDKYQTKLSTYKEWCNTAAARRLATV